MIYQKLGSVRPVQQKIKLPSPNSLLVLKMRFQLFSFASKKLQGFSSDRKILMSLLSVLFHLQSRVTDFGIFIFGQDIRGNVHYVRKINLIS